SKRSVAKRVAQYLRSTLLIRSSHSDRSCDMLSHLGDYLLKRLFGEGLGLGLLERAGRRRAAVHVMEVPTAVIEVHRGDIVISGHEIEIDDAFDAGRGPGYRLQHELQGIHLKDQGIGLVIAD